MGLYLKLLDLEGILVKMVVLLLVLEMERMLIGWSFNRLYAWDWILLMKVSISISICICNKLCSYLPFPCPCLCLYLRF